MDTLAQFIDGNPHPRELKRALAVQMSQRGHGYREIRDVLRVSLGFISEANQRYRTMGVDGLKLNYWGTQGYLSKPQKQELLGWLNQQDYWTIEEIIDHIEQTYGVTYQSLQSYYTLLQEAGFSWKKAQPTHPDKDDEQIQQKKNEIMELLVEYRSEIASGQVRVMFLDECHLLWGDISGHGWSRRNKRVDVEIPSTRERQTYYGALDYLTKRFMLHEYSSGNGENTVGFLKYLQSLSDECERLVIIWDGASYHRGALVKEFLEQVNGALPPEEWKIRCIRLAPNAPEQNPVEDIGCKRNDSSASLPGCARDLAQSSYCFS